MARIEFDPPERFVAGTVGPPGQRVFFLQARSGNRLYSVSLEKVQVSLLADRMGDLLDQLSEMPVEAGVDDLGPLEAPIEDSFRVNTIGLGWDEPGALVVECHDRDTDDDSAGEPETLRVVLPPDAARSFVRRARALVASGRPPCPFCGQPLDPTGHICARANGYRR